MLDPLLGTAALIAFVHTIAGPDHYLPFIAMSKARDWSFPKTMSVTLVCGIGHVVGSVALGFLGIALGLGVERLGLFEGFRGDLAGWFLLGFGLAYLLWGLRHAWLAGKNLIPHHKDHSSLTPWLLFIAFALGPCEPLIPILMYPAFNDGWLQVVLVTTIFTLVTLTTMTAAVFVGFKTPIKLGKAGHWAHAMAGAAVLCCGIAIQLGL